MAATTWFQTCQSLDDFVPPLLQSCSDSPCPQAEEDKSHTQTVGVLLLSSVSLVLFILALQGELG